MNADQEEAQQLFQNPNVPNNDELLSKEISNLLASLLPALTLVKQL